MRPTTYTPEVVALAKSYVHEYEELGEVIPTVVGLCRYISRSKSTVYSWMKDEDKQEFLDTVNEIEEYQHIELLSGGLKGAFNSQITKLVLHNHGYSDKAEVDNKSSDGSLAHPGYKIVDE